MSKSKLRFFITREPYGMGLSIRMAALHENGSIDVGQPVEFKHYEKDQPTDGEVMLNVGSWFDDDALQNLMDELWREGVRPKDIGTAGHLAATQAHLEDMRKIAFSVLVYREQPK